MTGFLTLKTFSIAFINFFLFLVCRILKMRMKMGLHQQKEVEADQRAQQKRRVLQNQKPRQQVITYSINCNIYVILFFISKMTQVK